MWNQAWAWLRDTLPLLQWLPDYTTEALRGDATAGLTVGVMLIPQGMAYAVIAGVPPIYGLYAGLVPLLVYPLIGSSRHLALGPVSIDMLIIAAGVGAIAQAGTERYVALAILLTAMVGLLQMAMGAMKLGFVANLLSRPVIAGLTTAASFIIAISQIGSLLGVELGRSQYIHVLLIEAVQNAGNTHLLTLGIGTASIVLLMGLPRWLPKVPEALIVVVAGTLAGWGFGLREKGVSVVGSIPQGLPAPELWTLSFSDLNTLLPAAITLALVQFMKDISLDRIFAARHGYTIDANRELIGVGAGNFFGSLFQSIPASGSFSRSAVNEQSGAQTALANVFAAGVIALTLLFLTPLFYHLPTPVLAAIIIVSGFGLFDLRELRSLFKARRRDGYIALFTAGCTLFIGIQEGILLGIGTSVVAMLYRISRPNVAELGHVPGTRLFRDLDRFEQAARLRDIMVLRVDAAFSFANAEYFKDFILEKSEREGRPVKVVIVDGSSINGLDTTAIDALFSVTESLEEEGIELHLTGLIGPVREVVRRSGLHALLGENKFHLDPHQAVVSVLERWDAAEGTDRVTHYFNMADSEETEATPAAS
ncbi:SulP family sulfate permease [Salinibacter ruber]|jgi:high affinity sulphate transporter 1|uniref:Sulfate transporter n=3 Tax=Salinibacter ruber TaxID=146919 RepID=Q2S0D7_SALRD|nr:sulfate permease [Salinibacter ruber]ABC46134.1 sulfate transporter [Salinibacter ruber DSM 13855]MBB4061158.1 SulP family sulfate permease [Salinibacter ruber]MBB4068880.1 SulP family sulfate permease [Salinibacter ruber]MBB4088476.1 SulP family sulfate permease [Salinibacter ruber]MCS3611046.1 SulP family sulfate permease [Salinibacter ruber]